MTSLARRLAEVDRFVDAAKLVSAHCKLLGVFDTRVVLGQVEELREYSVAMTTHEGKRFFAPLVGERGWFGTLACTNLSPISQQLERDLAIVATELSVWCTQRGIDARREPDCDAPLAPRQRQVAELAARGHTNDEIATALAISINTVKGRLKEVYERLGVRNRAELVAALHRRR